MSDDTRKALEALTEHCERLRDTAREVTAARAALSAPAASEPVAMTEDVALQVAEASLKVRGEFIAGVRSLMSEADLDSSGTLQGVLDNLRDAILAERAPPESAPASGAVPPEASAVYLTDPDQKWARRIGNELIALGSKLLHNDDKIAFGCKIGALLRHCNEQAHSIRVAEGSRDLYMKRAASQSESGTVPFKLPQSFIDFDLWLNEPPSRIKTEPADARDYRFEVYGKWAEACRVAAFTSPALTEPDAEYAAADDAPLPVDVPYPPSLDNVTIYNSYGPMSMDPTDGAPVEAYWDRHGLRDYGARCIAWALAAQPATQPTPAPAESPEPVCAGCQGSGTVTCTTSHLGPDDYDFDAECAACGGSGSPDLKDAINSIGMLMGPRYTGGPSNKEFIGKAEVLQVMEARAALASTHLSEDEIGAACYQGNTVSYMFGKAKAYGDELTAAWDVLREFGHRADGHTRLKDKIRQAISEAHPAASAVEPVGQWQPIETAPKDGRIVQLLDDACVRVGRYVPGNEYDVTPFWQSMGYRIDTNVPTHWAPLLPAIEAEVRAKGRSE